MKVKDTTDILQGIRHHMNNGSCSNGRRIDAVIVAATDAHISNYLLAAQDKRTDFITGFTGGVGTAVVTYTDAVLWVAGSRNRQAEKEVDKNWKVMQVGLRETPTVQQWLCSTLAPNSSVGINHTFCSIKDWNSLSNGLKSFGHKLVALTSDIVDEVWKNKPKVLPKTLLLLPTIHAGQTVYNKFRVLWEKMKRNACDWLILSALDDVAWMLNIRGNDIEHNTVFFAYIIVGMREIHLFIQPHLLTGEVKLHLKSIPVVYHPYENLFHFLVADCFSGKVWLAQNTSNAIRRLLDDGNAYVTPQSPVALMKTVKNQTEIEGMKKANLLDSIAYCQFLEWLENEVPHGNVTECKAAKKIMEFREKQEGFITSSFPVLSASGPNSSYEHYSPYEDDDRHLSTTETYYHDSGAHYLFGTTDTARGVHFGIPSQKQKECYTRVLKGHIALATIVFPLGTKGHTLDILGRMHLWEHGLDYTHGTGHGVGCGLNVTEGPDETTRIIKNILTTDNDCILLPGMVVTDEPGYYDGDNFGFRIENEMLCVEADVKSESNFKGVKYLKFETITFLPIQKKMIEPSMLTPKEVKWLNDYHENCRVIVGEEMKRQNVSKLTLEWLFKEAKQL